MKANLKDVLEAIPDFDDFMKLADEIGELSFKKMQLDNVIKGKEALIVTQASTDVGYFMNGKAPSMSYIESTYKYTGFDGKLLEERTRLADITSQLEKKKIQLAIYRDMLEVFRTVSANERSVAI
jgi:hypothetical protein